MTPQELLKQYDFKGPYVSKGLEAKFYYGDFIQHIFVKWGKFIDKNFPGRNQYITFSFFITDNWLEIYYFRSELEQVIRDYTDLVKEHPDFLQTHYQTWKDSCKRLEQAFDSDDYLELCEAYLDEYSLACAIPEAFSFTPEGTIIPAVKEYVEKYNLDFQSTFALLTSPIVDSFITQEERELSQATDLKKHQQKWHWLRNNYAVIQELDVKFFADRKKKIKTPPLNNFSHQKQELFSKYPPSDNLKLYVQFSEMFSEMQDVRKACLLKANYYHKKYLEKLSQEKNISLDDLENYSYLEIKKLILNNQKADPQEIAQRQEIVFAITLKEGGYIFSGPDAKIFQKHFYQSSDNKEIKGIVANQGKARGTVKIIFKSEDVKKVNSGDILVTSMTRPEIVVAMKKAAAIVTDEGGITSHAAIVSRELGVPCILATKHATKVLKDGDRVEVDADNGLVKKI